MKRAILNSKLSELEFRQHYFLKEELVAFCKINDINCLGSKENLSDRIAIFLKNGTIVDNIKKTKRKMNKIVEINLDSVIEANFVCSEKHRVFFKEQIGSKFTFNVSFQKWLKENNGKTYRDAIEIYHTLINNLPKTKIDKQFEYNQYIRDFFSDNKNRNLKDAIKCWYYKRNKKGSNKYNKSDLQTLSNK